MTRTYTSGTEYSYGPPPNTGFTPTPRNYSYREPLEDLPQTDLFTTANAGL